MKGMAISTASRLAEYGQRVDKILEEFQKRRPSTLEEAYRNNNELKERLAKVVAQYSNGTSPR